MSKKIILLVDDDPTLSEVIKKRIEDEGYICLWEKDGDMGLSTLKSVRPNLLLLDIIMPKISGNQVLEAISADSSLMSIPIMVISNSGEPTEIQRILGLGVRDFIIKAHFSPEEVVEKIKGLIGLPDSEKSTVGGGKKIPQDTKILIVEDDATLSYIASERFRFAGYQVFTAMSGPEGINMAREIHPDIVLLDVIMPEMSGFEVLSKMKQDGEIKDITVVIFSNLAQEQDFSEARRLGAVDFLVKANFTPAQLVERIDQILSKI